MDADLIGLGVRFATYTQALVYLIGQARGGRARGGQSRYNLWLTTVVLELVSCIAVFRKVFYASYHPIEAMLGLCLTTSLLTQHPAYMHRLPFLAMAASATQYSSYLMQLATVFKLLRDSTGSILPLPWGSPPDPTRCFDSVFLGNCGWKATFWSVCHWIALLTVCRALWWEIKYGFQQLFSRLGWYGHSHYKEFWTPDEWVPMHRARWPLRQRNLFHNDKNKAISTDKQSISSTEGLSGTGTSIATGTPIIRLPIVEQTIREQIHARLIAQVTDAAISAPAQLIFFFRIAWVLLINIIAAELLLAQNHHMIPKESSAYSVVSTGQLNSLLVVALSFWVLVLSE